jgi:hypothetical protein
VRAAAGPLALAGCGAALGTVFLLLVRRLVLSEAVVAAGRTLDEVRLFSPGPADLVTRVNAAAGHAIYPGVLALLLALVGIAALARRPAEPSRRILPAFGPLAVLAGALSLGPRMPGLPLFDVAFHVVPFWNFIRQPGKLQVLVALGLAMLAGAGAGALGAGVRQAAVRAGLGILLALGIAAEYHPWRPVGVSLLPARDAATEAVRTLGPRALYVPLWPGDSSFSALYLYTTTLTQVPMLNGYSAFVDRAYVENVYRRLETVNLGHVGTVEHAALRRLGVRQVVLDREGFPLKVSPFGSALTLSGLRGSPFLDPAAEPAGGNRLWIFRVREEPRPSAATGLRSPLGAFWEAESLRHTTGRIVADTAASNGRVVVGEAGRDRPGFVTYGPYRLLPPGEFRVLFGLRGRGTGVELQVTTADGARLLASRRLRLVEDGPLHDVPLVFTLAGPAAVEFRTEWDGEGTVAVDYVLATFAGEPDPASVFEVEALGHELGERADPAASGGVAGYADPAWTPPSGVWTGPFRRYPAGRYRLWVRVRLDRPLVEAFLWCGAQAASAGQVLGGRELLGSEVSAPSRYVELPVPFTLPRSTVVELPCVYRGRVGVWIDRLRVEGPLP